MGFNCGIVGLPNVGKSTLFNALTAGSADAENYPFCTIEPNVGRVSVPDFRLNEIATLAGSPVVVPTSLEFIDIAGLVRGASSGEGLGNQFLAQIREVDAIVHVVRCFGGNEITHTHGTGDPVSDVQVVEMELMLSDLESLQRRREALAKKGRTGDKDVHALLEVIGTAEALLAEGKPARSLLFDGPKALLLSRLGLLSAKPVMYVCNVDELAVADGNSYSVALRTYADRHNAACVVASARIESEISTIEDAEERGSFLESLGSTETGLARVVSAGYSLLGLITFFTAGPKEARAWTLGRGGRAVAAAAKVHSDFARGFIRAETISYEDYVSLGGEIGARAAGRMRQEGRDYVVKDGDVILFRFNV